MENATKALLIAAGVLIGIIILSMLLLGYNQISNYYQQQSDNLSLKQIVELNKKFTNYDGKTIRGNEMLSVINSVVDYNTWVTQNANEGYEEIQLNISKRKTLYLLEELIDTKFIKKSGSGKNVTYTRMSAE